MMGVNHFYVHVSRVCLAEKSQKPKVMGFGFLILIYFFLRGMVLLRVPFACLMNS